MCWDNLFSGTIGGMICALGAFACAYYAADKNKKLDKDAEDKKTLDDLYYVVTQLSGFINYFQFACKMNSAFSPQDYQNILNKIKNVDKKILDISQPFFYNSNFDDKVKIELCKFIESYIGWKGYGALLTVEVLTEYALINELQINAVDCLNEIVAQNSRKETFVNYVETVAKARGDIKKICLGTNESMKFIVKNLTFLFGSNLFLVILKKQINNNDDVNIFKVQEKIVCQCFKYIFSNHFFAVKNSMAGRALFYTDIVSIITSNDGTYLVDSQKKQYEISKIAAFLARL